ncbi:MAG: porin [Candidatus Aminicenantes bacterium]|nr:porin [Candidatus Aminicenantes bacterium]
MKRITIRTVVLVGLISIPLSAQTEQERKEEITVQTSGYMSFDFLKGQRQSSYHQGSAQDVRAGVTFSGRFAGSWDYALEARFRSESEFSLEQAFLRLALSEKIRVRAGLFLVPFGVYNTSNRPYEQALARVPLIVEEAYPRSWRDIGICVEGKFSFLDFAVYAGNGLGEGNRLKDGQQFRDRNADKGVGGRAGIRIDAFEFGYSLYRGKVDDRNRRKLILQAGDASWKTNDFQILAEYIQAWLDSPSPFGRAKCQGYHIQAFFPFNPVSFAIGRQELTYKDPFRGPGFFAPDVAGLGIDESRNRWALELLWPALPNLLVKAEYDFNREAGPKRSDDLFTAQVAFKF